MKLNRSIFFFHTGSKLMTLSLLIGLAGCTKLVEVDAPITNPATATVFVNDATAAAVLTSIYANMARNPSFAGGSSSIGVYGGVSADEFFMPANLTIPLRNAYTNSPNLAVDGLWRELYQNVYIANAAIEGIASPESRLTDSIRTQLTGEAKFMRAFLHFYLTNLFGDVPFVDTTDQWVNAVRPRDTQAEVYRRIIADLTEAKALLSENYKLPSGAWTTAERARPNKWTATAMLARVYLYNKEWAKAEAEASLVLANTARFALATDLLKMTDKTSKEAIWHLQQTEMGSGVSDAKVYYLSPIPNVQPNPTPLSPNNPVALRTQFVALFEPGDKRRSQWVDSAQIGPTKYYCPAKYRVRTVTQPTGGTTIAVTSEYQMVIRLAELYLIRAEARARQDNVAGAQADLNAVRTRAGLGATGAGDQTTLLTAIENERQLELFSEWGHRWFDLKRTDRLNAVMPTVIESKAGIGAQWNPLMALYPLPTREIDLNPHLAPQNDGYN